MRWSIALVVTVSAAMASILGAAAVAAPASVATPTAAANGVSAVPQSAGEIDASTPQRLIESSSKAMLRDIDANRAAYRKDPTKLYPVVDRLLLPYFDVEYAARLVLGKNWRSATPEQRKRFIDAFYKSLLTNYADALADFSGDRLKVLPAAIEPGAQSATVRSEVKRSNGQKVPVNYSLRMTPKGWKAWDVVIEGISYVKSFREDFGAEIDQKGLDAVINRLEAQGAAPPRKT